MNMFMKNISLGKYIQPQVTEKWKKKIVVYGVINNFLSIY